jgi:hypothetical protein
VQVKARRPTTTSSGAEAAAVRHGMVKSGVIAALFVCRCAFATRSRPSTDALAVSCSPDRLAGNLPSDSLPDAAPSVRTRIENMDNSVNEILPVVNEAVCAFGDLGADDRRAQ